MTVFVAIIRCDAVQQSSRLRTGPPSRVATGHGLANLFPWSTQRVGATGALAVELSIREVKARFAEAVAAAARGECVVVTKHGRPFVELISARTASGMDFEKAAIVRHELGLDGFKVSLPSNFDYPAFTRQVLGLED